MSKANTVVISGAQRKNYFSYHAPTRTLVAEASQFNNFGRGMIPDTIVVGGRNDTLVTFPMIEVKRDQEGDVVHWRYYNAKEDLAINLFND